MFFCSACVQPDEKKFDKSYILKVIQYTAYFIQYNNVPTNSHSYKGLRENRTIVLIPHWGTLTVSQHSWEHPARHDVDVRTHELSTDHRRSLEPWNPLKIDRPRLLALQQVLKAPSPQGHLPRARRQRHTKTLRPRKNHLPLKWSANPTSPKLDKPH